MIKTVPPQQQQHTSVRVLERAHTSLPFPVFRHIVDFMGLLPTMDTRASTSLSAHFGKYYCRRCGEYITARRSSSRMKRRGPFHLACREKWFTPPERRLKNYHISHISLSRVINERPRHWYHDQIHCPVVFYSRQPRNCYRFIIPKTMQQPSSRWTLIEQLFRDSSDVKFMYTTNHLIHDIGPHSKFSAVPDMYLPELRLYMNYPTLLERRLDMIMASVSRTDMMEKFYPSSRQSVFEWMVYLKPDAFRWADPKIYRSMYPYVKRMSSSLRLQLTLYITPRRIMFHDKKWFQDILMDFPEVLADMTERDIRRFFRGNRAWFCDYYVHKQPRALHYITLIHPPKDNDEHDKGDRSHNDVRSHVDAHLV